MRLQKVIQWLALPLLFFSSSLPAQITLYSMENFIPYAWVESGKLTGIDVEIIHQLSQKVGIPITIKLVPWKRVIHQTKHGHIDGAFSLFRSEERESFANFIPTPIHESTFKVFVRKGEEFDFQSIDDLHGKFIGINTAFYLGDAFAHARKNKLIQIEESSTKQNIQKLHGNRIEVFIGNQQEVYYWLSKMGLSESIIALPKPMFPPRGAYLVISKAAKTPNQEDLIRRLSQALKEMQASGEIDKVYVKYGQR
ncbi:transporter substrate-binding domain-containing protein [Vibrio sp. S4M6]|uniref:substrate-binding periplasmic protein n=1 Tax=Vibrio sinus TaxID=2946865 RepID=UPI002029CD5F|nr:transporter substrate-binding domain-containing protein [Vibrio sinus]MCL9782451.1 transporter substrate-binding domain-containing protein [Vibrio sinus]